jgi:4-carboxymuconolactone decarboxylase
VSSSTTDSSGSAHTSEGPLTNAVLDDPGLQQGLNGIHPAFGDLCTRVAGEVWGKPLIDQATKALITIAIDVVNQGLDGPGTPFEAHVRMALKQNVSFEQIEELLLFTCAYAGFNKAAAGFGKLAEIKARIQAEST